MRIILLGAPGAGKGTQAAVLADKLGWVHIASGDIFRRAQASGSEFGAIARSYMEKGMLVPDEVVTKMILERLSASDAQGDFVLDGFPRTLEQAQALDRALGTDGRGVDKAIYIKMSRDELVRRLSGRWICRDCQAPYHASSAPPRVPGRCDRCGGELYQRPDDAAETVAKRIEIYLEQTAPLIGYYAQRGNLVEVDGEREVDQVSQDLLDVLT